ncbi:hypothetical protein BV25DRAFT_1802905, partial [Artomyces pyxidatus]
GAGKGLLATVAIARGAEILRDRPLLVMPHVVGGAIERGTQFIVDTLEAHNPQIFALHSCDLDARAQGRDLRGILGTNSISIGALPGHNADHGAVFEQISRINHSCSPNAHFRWNADGFWGEIRALRPIAKGEQVTISYQPVYQPYRVRQAALKEQYEFRCAFMACSRPACERQNSDKSRQTLTTITKNTDREVALAMWLAGTDLPEDLILTMGLQFAKMMDDEMLDEVQERVAIAHSLVTAYCALKEADKEKMWAERAAEYTMAATGSDGGWADVAKAPEMTRYTYWGTARASAANGDGA